VQGLRRLLGEYAPERLAGELAAAAPVQPPDASSAQSQACCDFPFAEPLLVVKIIELSQGCGKLGDPDMKEVVELEVVGRAIPPVRKRSIAVARARLPAEEVYGLVAGDLEYPRGAHADLWPDLPKSDPELLEQVLDVILSDAVLVGDPRCGPREVGRIQPLSGRRRRAFRERLSEHPAFNR
jgi:hypothetical protein